MEGITTYNENFVLPEDWEYVPINNVVLSTKLRDPSKNPNAEIKYVDVSGVSNELFRVKEFSILKGKEAPSRARKIIETNDVIFATVRPTLKRVAIIESNLNNELCSTGYCVLKPNKALIDFRFLYFFLLTDFYINEIQKYQRGASYPAVSDSTVKGIKIPKPSLPEQRNISHILSLIQSSIQKQEQIIITTTELKNALMKKLFTEGMNGEPLKETEIGLIPESWELVKIGDVYDFTSKARNLKVNVTDEVPFIPMDLIPDSNIFVSKYNLKKVNTLTSGTYIEDGDFLLAKITPSFENGKQAIVDIKPFTWAYATTEIIPIKERTGVSDKFYLFYYLLNDDVRMKLAGKMEGTTGRQRLSKSTLRDCLLPYTKVEEQKEIAEMLLVIDKKISFHKRKKQSLKSIFQSLLHHLMTGKIRVKDLSFEKEYKVEEDKLSIAAEP